MTAFLGHKPTQTFLDLQTSCGLHHHDDALITWTGALMRPNGHAYCQALWAVPEVKDQLPGPVIESNTSSCMTHLVSALSWPVQLQASTYDGAHVNGWNQAFAGDDAAASVTFTAGYWSWHFGPGLFGLLPIEPTEALLGKQGHHSTSAGKQSPSWWEQGSGSLPTMEWLGRNLSRRFLSSAVTSMYVAAASIKHRPACIALMHAGAA